MISPAQSKVILTAYSHTQSCCVGVGVALGKGVWVGDGSSVCVDVGVWLGASVFVEVGMEMKVIVGAEVVVDVGMGVDVEAGVQVGNTSGHTAGKHSIPIPDLNSPQSEVSFPGIASHRL